MKRFFQFGRSSDLETETMEIEDPENDLDSQFGEDDLVNHGDINGRMDRPPKDFVGLDLVELKVVREYEKRIHKRVHEYEGKIFELEAELDKCDSKLFSSAQEMDPDSSMDRLLNQGPELTDAKKKAQHAKKRCEDFKNTHRLQDDVKRKKKAVKFWWSILLIVVLGIETYINGKFFADQAGGNFFDWFMQALLISAVNVGLFGSLIMVCWRYKVHFKQSRRNAAWVGLIVFGLLAQTFNLGVAHYRDAADPTYPEADAECYRVVIDPDDDPEDIPKDAPGREAICLYLTEGLRLSEFESYSFFLMGLGFILIGIIDLRHLSPGYPGHVRVAHTKFEAQDKFIKKKKTLLKQLKNKHRYYKEQLNGADSDIRTRHERAVHLVRQMKYEYTALTTYVDDIARSCRHDINIYRVSNRLARESPENIPDAWSSDWKQPASWQVDSSRQDDLRTEEDVQRLHEQNLQKIREKRASLDSCYKNAVGDVHDLIGGGGTELAT